MSNFDNKLIIDFENVYVNYGLTTVLENVNLKVKNGENWAILGANGSGKSTLLKLFSNDLYPNTKYEFKKELFGQDRWDIFELKKYLGIVSGDLQNKFFGYSSQSMVMSVVLSGYYSSLGVFSHHDIDDKQYDSALSVMDFLGILGLKDKKFGHLSTGQQRLCIIARSLIHNPVAFVLDEPTTGLDIKAKRSFLQTVQKLAADKNIILVTHDVEEIIPEITHVALMYNKTIYKSGLKDEIMTSENLSQIFETNINLQKNNSCFFVGI